jgi:hypothetical protein
MRGERSKEESAIVNLVELDCFGTHGLGLLHVGRHAVRELLFLYGHHSSTSAKAASIPLIIVGAILAHSHEKRTP